MYLTVVHRSIICGNLTIFNGAQPTDLLCNRIWKKSVVANSVVNSPHDSCLLGYVAIKLGFRYRRFRELAVSTWTSSTLKLEAEDSS